MSMDITPNHLRCGMGSCPSVHILEDGRLEVRGDLVVIHETLAKAAGHEVKTAEATVVIPAEYFSALPELVRLREENERLKSGYRELATELPLGKHMRQAVFGHKAQAYASSMLASIAQGKETA